MIIIFVIIDKLNGYIHNILTIASLFPFPLKKFLADTLLSFLLFRWDKRFFD